MSLLETIRSLVQSDLTKIDRFISGELKSEIPLINQLIDYILMGGGKRIRPLIVLLAGHAFQCQKPPHIELASAIELIHTATLLHDDVVDSSTLRRGQETANSIWGNEASVLVGDFLYSRAFQLIVKLKHLPVLTIFSDATNIIAEGEVLQLLNCHNPNTTEASYFEVITRKTAKLFEVAAQSGAALSTKKAEYITAMQHYGLHLGIAYQLIDDVLDYSASAEQTGKNMGDDLAEGKPTLPLIYALTQSTPSQATLLRRAIETGSTTELPSIIKIIESTGAIKYTANAAKQYAKQARDALAPIPESPYRKALHALAEFVVERNY
ncbi:MAG: ispB [Gammaproteobacteria bacterium]|jgi:octaprenyl-diphosphate synthase|nr:ispB [Gammaproteobacteria bacterium]